jgi:hypothetical protein
MMPKAVAAILAVLLSFAPFEIVWSAPEPLPFPDLASLPGSMKGNSAFNVCPGVQALDGIVDGELWRMLVAPATGRFLLIRMDVTGPDHEHILIVPAYGWGGRLGPAPKRALNVEREGAFSVGGMWGDSPCPALLGR